MSEEKRIVEWKVDNENKDMNEPERRSLNTMIGETIVISEVNFGSSEKYGMYVTFVTDKGEFYSFGKKIIDQSNLVENLLHNGYDGVRTKVSVDARRMTTFSKPTGN